VDSKDDGKQGSVAALSRVLTDKSFCIQTDPALLEPSIPGISSVGQKAAEAQPIQNPEAVSSLPITAITVESSTVAKLPDDSSQKVEANRSKTTSFVAPLDSTETIDFSPNVDNASSSAEENSRKDGGKSTANRVLNSAADRKAGNPANSSPESINVEPPKFELTPSAHAPQVAVPNVSPAQIGNVVLGGQNTPSTAGAPTLKDTAQGGAASATHGEAQQQPTLVQSAHLATQIGKSDVKIALQGEQFGSVELHAKVTGDQVSASITVDHHETHALLFGDLPVLHQVLNERQIRVSEIILLHHSLSSSSSSDDGKPSKDRETLTQDTVSASGNGGEESPYMNNCSSPRTDAIGIFDSKGRLSVRA
jgi:flagellar hook-length control protein FliK